MNIKIESLAIAKASTLLEATETINKAVIIEEREPKIERIKILVNVNEVNEKNAKMVILYIIARMGIIPNLEIKYPIFPSGVTTKYREIPWSDSSINTIAPVNANIVGITNIKSKSKMG